MAASTVGHLWRRVMIQYASRVLSVIVKQIMAVCDQNEAYYSVVYHPIMPVGLYTNCHMILWYGRVQSVHREIQGTIIKHSRRRLHRRQEICIPVATWWSRSTDIYSLHLLAYPCAETNTFGTGSARNPAISKAFEQGAAIQTTNGETRTSCK